MPGFRCHHCGYDLIMRIDLLSQAIKDEYPDGDFPVDLSIDGACENCGKPFVFSGEMFSHYVISKIKEGVISPEVNNYEIIEFDVSEEELEEFREVLERGDPEEIQAFVRRLMLRDDD